MEYSLKGFNLTSGYEGYREKAYKDSGGVWTCGYGHTQGIGPSSICTPTLAQQWLKEDIQGAVNTVNHFVTVPLTQNQFDALVDLVFNIGSRAFQSSTLLRHLNERNYMKAAAEFPKWNHVNGKIVPGLTLRRIGEQVLFNTLKDL